MDVKTTFRNLVRDQSVSICMLHSTKDRHSDRQPGQTDKADRQENKPTDRRTASTCVLCKKIRSKFAILKKFATRTPVSTKRTNRVASKKHTSGTDKKTFLSDLISRGLMGKHIENSDQNSTKNFSVLAGLRNLVFLMLKEAALLPRNVSSHL